MPSLYLYGSREKEGFLFPLSSPKKNIAWSQVKRAAKRVMCFAILLPNELKSGVARFTTNVRTYLATNQVVADCGSSCKM